jgi:hypothetical protein
MMEQLKPSIILDKALDTSKLTRKEITVTRGGTTFKQTRWVRPEQVINKPKENSQDDEIGTAKWLLDKDRDDNYKPIDKTKLVQPTGDIEDLYKRAQAVRPVFREWMEQVKNELGAAELLSRPALKSKERVKEKIAADGEKDASHIYDIDGHTLVFDDLDGVARALKYFLAHKATIRVKNNFAHPTALGYRDININVKLPNGMISEVQLNTKAMLEAKEKTAHIFYEVSREAETQCPPPPPPAPYSDVVEAQRAIYRYAWDFSRSQRDFDETSFNASVFEIARPFWSKSINIIAQDATWLSEKTRKAFQALGSKANTLSSTSKNFSPSLSKSSFGIIVPPYAKHSTDKGRFAIGIDNITKSINKNKLIRKPVIVLREGKTYQATRWVRPNEVASQDIKESQAFGDSGDSEHYMLQMVNDKPIEYDEKTIKIVYGSKDAYERANAQLLLNSFAPRGDEDLYTKAGDGQVREHGEAESGGGARRRAAPVSPLLSEANKPVHPAFTENRKGQRRVSFVGQTVSGPKDIAELFQVYRNPQIESFHIIYLDSKGKILAHNAISSGTPGMTIAFHRWSDSGERWILNNRIDRLGADNVIILHNHPSGDVTPSSEDMAVTEAYSKMLGDKFGGHVIIDHDEATFIDSRAQSAVSLSYTPKEGSYDINLKYQIKGYSDAAKYAIDVMSVSGRKGALILTDTYLRIIEWRPFESANPRDIYQAVNESGGARAFIATSDADFFDSVIEADNKAKSNGGKYRVLMDVVLVDKGKFINNSQRDINGTDHYAYIINKKANRKAVSTKISKYLFEPHTDKYEKALEGKNMYDELLKARNPKLVQRIITVHGPEGVFQRRAWVLPSEVHTMEPHKTIVVPYVAEGGSAYEPIPDAVKNKEPRLITVEIASKGRKYLKAHYKGKTFDFNVAINDVTKDFEPGKSYTFPAIEQKEVNKYGTKLTYWPVDVDAEKRAEIEKKNEIEHEKNKAALQQRIEAENKKEIERWLGYVEDKANDGYLYQNGVSKLKELHIEKWPDLDERLKEAMTKAERVALRMDTKKNLEHIEDNLGKYWSTKGESRVLENIAKLKNQYGVDTEKYESKLKELKEAYERQKEYRETRGYKGKVYHIAGGSGYGFHEFYPDTVIRNPEYELLGYTRNGEPKYLYVLSASKEYYPYDGMSFGVGDEKGYVYEAFTREATEDESEQLRKEDERRERIAKVKGREEEIIDFIKTKGEFPHGDNNPEGERLLDTQDIYGGGDWFVVGNDYIWYVRNNGMDTDNWGINNVRTGGAGAIGWRVPYSKELADELRRLDQIMKMPELEKVSIKKAIVNIGSKLLGRKEKSKANGLIARMKKLYPDEFAVGAKVEMEHTNDPHIAEIIAAQHLSENDKYYKKLLAADLVDEPEAIVEAKKMGLSKSIRFVISKSLPEEGDVEYTHKTPPKGYPKTKKKYADPNNYKYPLDTEKHVRAAIAYFSKPKNYSIYSPDERHAMWNRILRAAKKFGIEVSDENKFEKQ